MLKADISRAVSGCQGYFDSLVRYFSVVLAQPTQIGQSLVAAFDFGSLECVPGLRFQSSVLLHYQDSEASQNITQISLESYTGFEDSKLVLNF